MNPLGSPATGACRRLLALIVINLACTALGVASDVFDANSLPATSNLPGALVASSMSGAAGGELLVFQAEAVGDTVEFRVPVEFPGEFSLSLRYLDGPGKGVVRLAVDGNEQGPVHDARSDTESFVTLNYGKLLVTASEVVIRLQIAEVPNGPSQHHVAIDTLTLQRMAPRTSITAFTTIAEALNSGVPLYAPPGTYTLPANFTPSAPIDILGSVTPGDRPVFQVSNPSLLPSNHSIRFQGIKFAALVDDRAKVLQITTQQFDLPSYTILDCTFEACTPVAWATAPSITGQAIRRLEARRFSISGANRGLFAGGRVDDYDITDFLIEDCSRFGVCIGPSGKGIIGTIESFMKRGQVARGTVSGTIMDTDFNQGQLLLTGNNVVVADMNLLNMVLPPEYYTNAALATSYPTDCEPFYTKVEYLLVRDLYIVNDGANQAMWGHKGASLYTEDPISPEGRDATARNVTFVNTGVRRAVGIWHQTHGTHLYQNFTMHNRTNDAVIIHNDSATGSITIENWVDLNLSPTVANQFPGVRNRSRDNIPPAPAPVAVAIINSPTINEYPASSIVDTLGFEHDANTLTTAASSGEGVTTLSNAQGTNGNLSVFNADGAGDFIAFRLNVPIADNYRISTRFFQGANRGIYQLSVDGIDIGEPLDLFGNQFVTLSLGELPLAEGPHTFRFTATGKNPASNGYRLGLDLITLTRIGPGSSPAPSGLIANSSSPTTVTLAWVDNSGDETGFVVERRIGTNPAFTVVATLGANWRTFADSGLTPGTYTYRVAAMRGGVISDYTNLATISTAALPPPTANLVYDANALTVIASSGEATTNLAQATGNNGNIRVFNADGLGDFIAFRVNVPTAGNYRVVVTYFTGQNRGVYQLAIDASDFGAIQDVYGTGGLLPIETGERMFTAGNHEFRFTVVDRNPSATSFRLGLDTIRLIPIVSNAPAAPTALTATADGSDIELSWIDVPEADNFLIQRRDGNGGAFATIATIPADVSSFRDTNLAPDTPYSYRVAAINSSGTSDYSNETNARTAPDPRGVAQIFDANTLAVTGSSGQAIVPVSNSAANGGNFLRFDAAGPGDYLSVAVELETSATYAIEAVYHLNPFRGIVQLEIDGSPHGSLMDLYSGAAHFGPAIYPDKFLRSGTHIFTFRMVGKNDAAAGFQFGLDRFVLIALAGPAPSAPVITEHPTSTTTTVGTPVSFTVSASGIPDPNYQWRFEGQEIQGATAPTLTLHYPTLSDSGAYDVVVANLMGQVTSESADLVVSKNAASIALGKLAATYNGAPQPVIVETQPTGLNVIITYDGSVTAPNAAGSYTVNASIDDSVYEGAITGTLVISRAPASIFLTDLQHAYDGTGKSASVTTSPARLGVVLLYDGEHEDPILPGKYDVDAAITDSNFVGFAQGMLEINAAALVNRAPTVSGAVAGSIQLTSPEDVQLNGSAMIAGDLLVPGTPAIRFNGFPELRGVQDSAGIPTPTNYEVRMNGNATLRDIVRRVDPVAMPPITLPHTPTGTRSVTLTASPDTIGDFATVRDLTLNGSQILNIPPGAYGNLTLTGHSSLVLGGPGSPEPTVYHFQKLSLHGQVGIELAGPTIIHLANGFALNGAFGSREHPEWLEVRIASGTLLINGNAIFFGRVVAPNSEVIINGALHGEVICDRLTLNGSGLLAQPQ